jgi:hypothetical protein
MESKSYSSIQANLGCESCNCHVLNQPCHHLCEQTSLCAEKTLPSRVCDWKTFYLILFKRKITEIRKRQIIHGVV